MGIAQHLDQVRPDVFVWHAYDSTVKADLFSTAITLRAGCYLIDPIKLSAEALADLHQRVPLAGVVVTNANHLRSAGVHAGRFSLPLFASRESDLDPGLCVEIADGGYIGNELEVISIAGAPPGEIALYRAADGGTLIIGDALINFEPHGFALLPDKYCENAKQMRAALRKLSRYKCERMLFAHGTPILSRADLRLRQLLEGDL